MKHLAGPYEQITVTQREWDEVLAQRDALAEALESLYNGVKGMGFGGSIPASMRKASNALSLVRENATPKEQTE